MATKILNKLDGAQEKLLKMVKKNLKKEASGQLMKYKALIPTEASIKQMMVDEVIKQGTEVACSIEGQKFITDLKEKITNTLNPIKDLLTRSKESLDNIQKQIDKINEFVAKILALFDLMEGLILAFGIIKKVAQISIKLLKAQFADGDLTIKLKDLIDNAKQKQEEFKGTIATFKFKVNKTISDILKPTLLVQKAINAITALTHAINAILALIVSFFSQYLNLCGLNNNGEVEDILEDTDPEILDLIEDPVGLIDNTSGTEYIDYLHNEELGSVGYRRYKI